MTGDMSVFLTATGDRAYSLNSTGDRAYSLNSTGDRAYSLNSTCDIGYFLTVTSDMRPTPSRALIIRTENVHILTSYKALNIYFELNKGHLTVLQSPYFH